MNPLLSKIRIRNAIEQHMNGSEGMYHQKNMEKRRTYSVREWADLSMRTDLRAPTRDELGRNANPNPNGTMATRTRGTRSGRASRANGEHVTATALEEAASRLPTPAPEDNEGGKEAGTPGDGEHRSIKAKSEPPEDEDEDEAAEDEKGIKSLPTPPGTVADSPGESHDNKTDEKADAAATARSRKRARLEERHAKDEEWLKTFDPATHWLPPGLKAEDYNPEFCQLLEKVYWRSCGLQGKKPMYGADLEGKKLVVRSGGSL